ncbi:hypothetical protein MNV49_005342 [Pseudohyphozyma bogoriensis]|nr:hypothetical protein MNV49_005342 [Pseudohyphozyma bogoriensis]
MQRYLHDYHLLTHSYYTYDIDPSPVHLLRRARFFPDGLVAMYEDDAKHASKVIREVVGLKPGVEAVLARRIKEWTRAEKKRKKGADLR